jgi:hypothetical protein
MSSSILYEIRRIQGLSTDELQLEWPRLYNGETCRSRNRPYLVKRLCWRLQERRLGGLSDRARARLKELAPDGFTRARTPHVGRDAAEPAPVEKRVRDMRLPSPGAVLTRQYRGREIRVVALADGFEWDGRRYGSLSEVARAVTGARWNGRLFFALTQRKRRT